MKKSIGKKHRRFRIILNSLLILTIIIILMVISLNSEFFNIDKINVQGNKKISKEKIIHTSLINLGENIFRISIEGAEENILELPYIKSVEISRSLPKGIDIHIVEREEKVLVKNISIYYVIDEEGYLLDQIDSNNESLPVVFGLKTDKIDLGDNIFLDLELEEFEDLIKEAENLRILSMIDKIIIESEEDVNISLYNGIDVAFGALDNVEYKLRLLDEILNHSDENNILINRIIMNRDEHPIIVIDD